MSQLPGIIPLLKRFRQEQISAEQLHGEMGNVLVFCEKQLVQLQQIKVVPKDKALWDSTVLPALELSFKGLMAIAQASQEYARQPLKEIAEAIVFMFSKIDQATTLVEQQLGFVSEETQQMIHAHLNVLNTDQVALAQQQAQGTASPEVNLFD